MNSWNYKSDKQFDKEVRVIIFLSILALVAGLLITHFTDGKTYNNSEIGKINCGPVWNRAGHVDGERTCWTVTCTEDMACWNPALKNGK